MIALVLLTAAQAAEPAPVDAVLCARNVRFVTPYAWHWSAEPLGVVEATALVVRVDPDLARPRAAGQRVLYVEGWPAEVLWRGADTELVLAPMVMPDTLRAWFGDDTLPERVDAAHRKAEGERARDIPAMTPKSVAGGLLWDGTRRGLVGELRGWMAGCGG